MISRSSHAHQIANEARTPMPQYQKQSHYPNPANKQEIVARTLAVLVDNEPGVLARVIGLFSGRGYNIDSLTVTETEHQKHLSRITIVTQGTPAVIEQIKHQLERMVPVHRVVDLTLIGEPRQGRKAHRGAAPGRDLSRERDRCVGRAFRVRDHRPDLEDRAIHLAHGRARPGRGGAHRHCRHRPGAAGDVRRGLGVGNPTPTTMLDMIRLRLGTGLSRLRAGTDRPPSGDERSIELGSLRTRAPRKGQQDGGRICDGST